MRLSEAFSTKRETTRQPLSQSTLEAALTHHRTAQAALAEAKEEANRAKTAGILALEAEGLSEALVGDLRFARTETRRPLKSAAKTLATTRPDLVLATVPLAALQAAAPALAKAATLKLAPRAADALEEDQFGPATVSLRTYARKAGE
jgi:hypothetical protein